MKTWLTSHQQLLSQQFSRKMLPHAILISGVMGAGKLELAKWLVNVLGCQQHQQVNQGDDIIVQRCGACKSCLLLNSNTYPDHLNIVAEKNSLGVDEIRAANRFLQKTAYIGHYKTVLIDNAQTMTLSAANALLKTLEEPSDNSIIILLTDDIEMLLPTVVSRCRVLNIRPDVGNALLHALGGQDQTIDGKISKKSAFVNLTQLPELTNKETKAEFLDFKRCYVGYLNHQQEESQLLQMLLNNKHALRWIEQITVNLLREQFIENTNAEQTSPLSSELLNKLYKVVMDKGKIIKTYPQANKQFVCEQLIMEISDLLERSYRVVS